MKRSVLIPLLVFVCVVAGARNPLELIRARLAEGRLTMNYSYRSSGKVPVTGKGTLTIEGDCYRMEGNGLQIICDGQCRWTVDPEAKEVYIESSLGIGEFLSHPETIEESLSCIEAGERELSGKYSDRGSGMEYTFRLSGIRSEAAGGDKSVFKFDCSALGADWLVSDLR